MLGCYDLWVANNWLYYKICIRHTAILHFVNFCKIRPHLGPGVNLVDVLMYLLPRQIRLSNVACTNPLFALIHNRIHIIFVFLPHNLINMWLLRLFAALIISIITRGHPETRVHFPAAATNCWNWSRPRRWKGQYYWPRLFQKTRPGKKVLHSGPQVADRYVTLHSRWSGKGLSQVGRF